MRKVLRLARANRLAATLALFGLVILAYGMSSRALAQPVWVFGLAEDFGNIDGDRSYETSFTVFNPHRSLIDLEVIAPGCGCDGRSYQRVKVDSLSGRAVTIVTDPAKMPLGAATQNVTFRGFVNDETFGFTRAAKMTVVRASLAPISPLQTSQKP